MAANWKLPCTSGMQVEQVLATLGEEVAALQVSAVVESYLWPQLELQMPVSKQLQEPFKPSLLCLEEGPFSSEIFQAVSRSSFSSCDILSLPSNTLLLPCP